MRKLLCVYTVPRRVFNFV